MQRKPLFRCRKVCLWCFKGTNIVRSWGTEGRCAAAGHPQDEMPPNDHVYENIVFRAADVVDLRIDDPSPSADTAAPPVSAPEQPKQVRTGPYVRRM